MQIFKTFLFLSVSSVQGYMVEAIRATENNFDVNDTLLRFLRFVF